MRTIWNAFSRNQMLSNMIVGSSRGVWCNCRLRSIVIVLFILYIFFIDDEFVMFCRVVKFSFNFIIVPISLLYFYFPDVIFFVENDCEKILFLKIRNVNVVRNGMFIFHNFKQLFENHTVLYDNPGFIQ